jgi:hypothetical protein
MSNQQQGANDAPKTTTPVEIKPDAQQNQGDGKPSSDKPGSEKPAQQK